MSITIVLHIVNVLLGNGIFNTHLLWHPTADAPGAPRQWWFGGGTDL